MSSTANNSSNLQSILNAALSDYAEQTGIDLARYPSAQTLQNCDSADAILDILGDKVKKFQAYRNGNRKLINCLKPVVQVLHAVSGILGEATAMVPFKPTKAILVGVDVLITTAIGISASYDALVDVFECLGNFLNRLQICTEIPFSPSMSGIVTKIMVEVLSVLSLATKQIKQGRLKKFAKKLLGESEIEDMLHRLDRLTLDEARMTGTQTLQVVHGLVSNMKLVIGDGTTSMHDIWQALVTIQETTSQTNKMKRNELQKDIRNWLSPPDPSKNHNIACEAKHHGTAEWFIQGSIFEKWNTTGSLLWIHGKSGSGKTILCSTVIQQIKTKCDRGLALMGYYYFDSDDIAKQGIRGLLASLLSQFCATSDLCYRILSDLYLENHQGLQQPNNEALVESLKKILRLPDAPMRWIIIDAIDECPNTTRFPPAREEVLNLLEHLVSLSLPNLRICVTSRPEVSIRTILEPLTSLHMSLHDQDGQKQDIFKYIYNVVSFDRRMQTWRPEDKKMVIRTLSAKVDGMFRRVYHQLETLRYCSPTDIRRALDSLDETYEQTLPGIEKDVQESAHTGRLFQCPTAAVPPLRVDEFAEVPPIRFLQPDMSSRKTKRKALIIGINYTLHPNPAFPLWCCVEDANAMANFLCYNLGFAREHITMLTDESQPWHYPTKDNILRKMRALVHDAQPHDSFFLFFSGHAFEIKDLDGDEVTGLDQCICAVDCSGNDPDPNPDTPGVIVDDVMHKILVVPLPIGCRLTAIFDCSHSGTLLAYPTKDLPYLYNRHGVVKEFRHPDRLRILRLKSSYADVVSLGACEDNQDAMATTKGGALRQAFVRCMIESGNNLTYKELIRNLREDMERKGFPQRPVGRRLPDVATLFALLTLTNVHSYQAPTKLIRTSRSSFRKTMGESSENPADTASARREADHQEIGPKLGDTGHSMSPSPL